jgi:hypothetical protein
MSRRLALGTFWIIAVLAMDRRPAAAQGSCGSYPHAAGAVEVLADGAIAATASATATFQDPSAVENARTDAEADARTAVSHFFSDTINDDAAIAKMVSESKDLQGEGKDSVRKETAARISRLRGNSKVLAGVVVIGSCYTRRDEIRVTVGIKPDTLSAADKH